MCWAQVRLWEGPHIFGGTLVGVLYDDADWLRAELFTCKDSSGSPKQGCFVFYFFRQGPGWCPEAVVCDLHISCTLQSIRSLIYSNTIYTYV